jgi:hypothetical protein
MSRLEKPLGYKTHWVTGDLLLRAELDLLLKDNTGSWQKETFRVDSGSDITSMPAWRAKLLNLPMPQAGVSLAITTPAGPVQMIIRAGILQARIDGMDATVYPIPCHFTGDPDAVPDPNAPPATIPRNLLGLAGVVDKLRLIFDGTPQSAAAPYGLLVVEKI